MTQLPMFQPEATWSPPRISDLPSWKGARRVGIDVETYDPLLKKLGPGVRRGGYVIGFSFALEDGPSHYVPIRHEGGDNIVEGPEAAWNYLREQAAVFTGDLCGANMQYDLDYLAEQGVVFRRVRFFRDCPIAEPLIDELQLSYSLENIAIRRGIPGKDQSALEEAARAWKINPKSEMYKLPARHVAGYAEHDAVLPLQLLRRQERDIEEQDLWNIYDLESRVLPVLVKMRRRGVRIDLQKLEEVERWSEKEEARNLEIIRAETGFRLSLGDVNKAELLAKPLESIGIELPRTAKTNKPSIKNMELGHLHHPVADAIVRARKVNKLRSTFVNSIRKHLIGDRVHCSFNQLRKTSDDESGDEGARYGRLSSCDPNLQQQPSRDDFANMWRSIYVPDGDGLWACCDYSQQEPRMLVHIAEKAGYRGAVKAANKYREDPSADNHTMMARIIYGYPDDEEPTKVHRTNAKIIFLGLCYGKGGASLARELGLPTMWRESRNGKQYEVAGPEAQSILDQFDRQVPFVKTASERCEAKAKKVGYVKTILGRRCRFEKHPSGKGYDWTYRALNRVIQGGSADQTKAAMVEADAQGFRLQLQVHDEIDQTVESPEHAEQLAEIMRNVVELTVPTRVDVELGPSWGEIK